jgi:NADPH:quinone reductase-like Zn-dependent oxidoreductase
MRAAVIGRGGAPVGDHVRLVTDWPKPAPGRGEVLARTRAAALNHLDIWIGMEPARVPWISGSDACGTVEAVGEGVDEAWIGRTIIVSAALPIVEPPRPGARPSRPPQINLLGSETQGTMAEWFTAPADNLVEVGDADPIAAAAFALTHLTAWRMIVSRARATPDQVALVTGIGGGVALAALGILKTIGCATIVTSRQKEKIDRARARGADHGLLDEGQDWSKQAREIAGGRGVDVVIDSVGAPLHERCLKSLAHGGTLVTCGASAGSEAKTDLGTIFWSQLSVLGSSMGSMDEMRAVTALFTSGALKPVVDSVHEPADAGKAYARLESGRQFGKVVVRWGA